MKNNPLLTIGLAHYDDFHGAYFTLQALRLYIPEVFLDDIEFIVIENNDGSPHAEGLNNIVNHINAKHKIRRIVVDKVKGTSATRDRIFTEASGEFVMVMDCHVLLYADALRKLMQYLEKYKGNDIMSGPLVLDNLIGMVTHFNAQWRGHMWGTWGTVWVDSSIKNPKQSDLFTVVENRNGTKDAVTLDLDYSKFINPGKSTLPNELNDKPLQEAGFRLYGVSDKDEAFSIPGQGLGLFVARRSSWLGFHPDARGFGGEELYIHEKYRKAGNKAVCLPFLKWVHRFGRPDGVKYPLNTFDRIRNYVLEFIELGIDTKPIHYHFVEETNAISQEIWDSLVADPYNYAIAENPKSSKKSCGACNQQNKELVDKQFISIEKMYDAIHQTPRDLEQHMPKLKEFADKVETVVDITYRKESTVAFLASECERVFSFNGDKGAFNLLRHANDLVGDKLVFSDHVLEPSNSSIPKCDLLFIDTHHTYQHTKAELDKYAPHASRFIILHDTDIFGEKGPDNSPGKMVAVRQYINDNPQWSVLFHTKDQYGLTVLGCQKQDKPKLPSKITMAKNFAQSMAKHVGSGGGEVPKDVYEERLKACSICEHRNGNNCSICGCYLDKKAVLPTSECPILKWKAHKPNAS